jgi:gas vesicle protein
MDSGKFVLGVLAGVAIGATLGVLLAPDKGSETRQKINDKSDEYTDLLEEKFNDLVDSLKKRFDEAKDDAKGAAKTELSKAGDAVAQAKSTVNHA